MRTKSLFAPSWRAAGLLDAGGRTHLPRRLFRHALGTMVLLLAGVPAALAAREGPDPQAEPAAAAPAPGGTPSLRQEPGEPSLRSRLHAIALRGAQLREQGEAETALGVLEQGHDEMLRHVRGGHWLPTYIDGVGLQAEYGMTLIQLGRLSLGDEFIATARRTIELAHARSRSGPLPQEAAARPEAGGVPDGEALELALADFHARHIEAPVSGLDARLASERMLEAGRRAEAWMLRRALAGTGGRAERVPVQRIADLRLVLARGLLAAGRPQDAAAEFVAAAALGCTLEGEPGRQRCARATQGWAEAAGTDLTGEKAFAGSTPWHQALGIDASRLETPDP